MALFTLGVGGLFLSRASFNPQSPGLVGSLLRSALSSVAVSHSPVDCSVEDCVDVLGVEGRDPWPVRRALFLGAVNSRVLLGVLGAPPLGAENGEACLSSFSVHCVMMSSMSIVPNLDTLPAVKLSSSHRPWSVFPTSG